MICMKGVSATTCLVDIDDGEEAVYNMDNCPECGTRNCAFTKFS